MASNRFRAAASFFIVPWGAFVAAFLYYVGVTLVAIGGSDLSDVTVAVIYLLPAAVYLLVLTSRALHGLAALPVHIGHLALPRLQ